MSRLRKLIAAGLAAATLSTGAAACTPTDQANFEKGVSGLLGFTAFYLIEQLVAATEPPCPPTQFCEGPL